MLLDLFVLRKCFYLNTHIAVALLLFLAINSISAVNNLRFLLCYTLVLCTCMYARVYKRVFIRILVIYLSL